MVQSSTNQWKIRRATLQLVCLALLVATSKAQLSNSTLQQLQQLCTTSYAGCWLSWNKLANSVFADGILHKQMGQLHDESVMCLLSATTGQAEDSNNTLVTQTCKNTTKCEQVTISLQSDKTYIAKLCMFRGHADTFLTDKQLYNQNQNQYPVSAGAPQSSTIASSNVAKQCMLRYLQKAAADSGGMTSAAAQNKPSLDAAFRAILKDCWSTSYTYVAAARKYDAAYISDVLDNMLLYDSWCQAPAPAAPAAAGTPLPAPANASTYSSSNASNFSSISPSAGAADSRNAALRGVTDACALSFLQQMPELRPDTTAADSAQCGVTELRNLDNCCEGLQEPLNLANRDMRGQLPATFTMAPLGTILTNNPYLCGSLDQWPSAKALNATKFGGGNYSAYGPAEAVLLRYLQQNSSQLVLFGLYNTKVALDMTALSVDAPYYLSAVVLQHLGRGQANAANLRGLPSPEQGVMACQLLDVSAAAVAN